jgi:hypothetical protein
LVSKDTELDTDVDDAKKSCSEFLARTETFEKDVRSPHLISNLHVFQGERGRMAE